MWLAMPPSVETCRNHTHFEPFRDENRLGCPLAAGWFRWDEWSRRRRPPRLATGPISRSDSILLLCEKRSSTKPMRSSRSRMCVWLKSLASGDIGLMGANKLNSLRSVVRRAALEKRGRPTNQSTRTISFKGRRSSRQFRPRDLNAAVFGSP